jgi:hypothetical protein
MPAGFARTFAVWAFLRWLCEKLECCPNGRRALLDLVEMVVALGAL